MLLVMVCMSGARIQMKMIRSLVKDVPLLKKAVQEKVLGRIEYVGTCVGDRCVFNHWYWK